MMTSLTGWLSTESNVPQSMQRIGREKPQLSLSPNSLVALNATPDQVSLRFAGSRNQDGLDGPRPWTLPEREMSYQLADAAPNDSKLLSLFEKQVAGGQIALNAQDEVSGWTFLHLATMYGHTDLAKHLIESMSPQAVSAQDEAGLTALLWAMGNKQDALVHTLIDAMSPAALALQKKTGQTALHAAVRQGKHAWVLHLLRKLPADVLQLADKQGETALHAAVMKQNDVLAYTLAKAMYPAMSMVQVGRFLDGFYNGYAMLHRFNRS